MAKKTAKKTRVTRKAAPAPSRYLYVEARGWFRKDNNVDLDAAEILDGPISFDSIVVRAKDEADAYNRGAALLQEQQFADPQMYDQGDTTDTDPAIEGSHVSGRFLNDYVVKL